MLVRSTSQKEKKTTKQRKKKTIISTKVKFHINISPTHHLRPVVRGQTNRYNMKQKLGRGFTKKELVLGGVHGVNYARSLGIAVDLRYENKR